MGRLLQWPPANLVANLLVCFWPKGIPSLFSTCSIWQCVGRSVQCCVVQLRNVLKCRLKWTASYDMTEVLNMVSCYDSAQGKTRKACVRRGPWKAAWSCAREADFLFHTMGLVFLCEQATVFSPKIERHCVTRQCCSQNRKQQRNQPKCSLQPFVSEERMAKRMPWSPTDTSASGRSLILHDAFWC